MKNPALHESHLSAEMQLLQLLHVLQIPLTLKYCPGQEFDEQSFWNNTRELMQPVQFVGIDSHSLHGLVHTSHLLLAEFL
jgi:hypothetical protein